MAYTCNEMRGNSSDAGASTTNIGNSILIMENSYSCGCETLETLNIFQAFESYYYFDLQLFYFRKICSPSQSSSRFI